MKVVLEIEYPNDKIFAADILPTRIVDLNYGIYFEGKAKVVPAIPMDWIHDYLYDTFLPESHFWVIQKMIKEWDKEHEKNI